MSETPFNPDEVSPEDRAAFGFPSEGSSPTPDQYEIPGEDSQPGMYEETVESLKRKERRDALSEETRNGLTAITENALEVAKHHLEYHEAWPKLADLSQRVRDDAMDVYYSYQRGELDEEEVRMEIHRALEELHNIRAMMNPDANPDPKK